MYIEATYAQNTANNTAGTINRTENIKHWEIIDFIVTSPELAAKLGVSLHAELNVKFAGNSNSVEDMKQAMLDFYANITESDKESTF